MVPPTLVARLVEAHMGGPFLWGVSDCCTGPANVFSDLTGIDVLKDGRMAYPSRKQMLVALQEAGGALAYVDAALQAVGLVSVPEGPGALGLLMTPRGFHGAVCLMPGAWAIKAKEGFTCVKSVHAIWGLPS